VSRWEAEPKPAWVEPPDPPRVGHARKDRKRWCRGRVGREHVLGEPQLSNWGTEATRRLSEGQKPCLRPEWYPRYWLCLHEVRCVTCGRIMRRLRDSECPDFTTEITRWRTRRKPTSSE